MVSVGGRATVSTAFRPVEPPAPLTLAAGPDRCFSIPARSGGLHTRPVNDPHIHVETNMSAAAARDVLAATFGLVANLPSVVTTGYGVQAPAR